MAELYHQEANLLLPFQDKLMENLVMEEGFHLAPNLATIWVHGQEDHLLLAIRQWTIGQDNQEVFLQIMLEAPTQG